MTAQDKARLWRGALWLPACESGRLRLLQGPQVTDHGVHGVRVEKVLHRGLPHPEVRGKSQSVDTEAFAPEALRARGGQSGDLEGLSNSEGADSQSVAELIEEGNAFEADAVTGVEHAGDTDEKEVRTHEVPQDDVPRRVSG